MADVLHAPVSHVFGEADIQAGQAVAGQTDDLQHGVVTHGVELQSDQPGGAGQDVLQQGLLSPLQSYPTSQQSDIRTNQGRRVVFTNKILPRVRPV